MSAVFEDHHQIAKIEPTFFDQYKPASIKPMAGFYRGVAPNVQRDAELSAAFTTIDEFRSMGENWDGYGALTIADAVATNAKRALVTLLTVAPCPDLSPNPNGTISMEWESESGYAVLEIGNTRFSFYLRVGTRKLPSLAGSANEISFSLGLQISEGLYPRVQSSGDRLASIIAFPSYVRPAY